MSALRTYLFTFPFEFWENEIVSAANTATKISVKFILSLILFILTKQCNIACFFNFSSINKFYCRFPNIHVLLAKLFTVVTIPPNLNVKGFKNKFSPAIKNHHVKFLYARSKRKEH